MKPTREQARRYAGNMETLLRAYKEADGISDNCELTDTLKASAAMWRELADAEAVAYALGKPNEYGHYRTATADFACARQWKEQGLAAPLYKSPLEGE